MLDLLMRAPIAKKDQTSRPARFPALSLHHKAGDVGDGPQGAEGVLSAGLLDEWTAMTPTCQSPALSSRLRYPNAYSDPASRQLMGTQNLVSDCSFCFRHVRNGITCHPVTRPQTQTIKRQSRLGLSLTHTRVLQRLPPKCVQRTTGPRHRPAATCPVSRLLLLPPAPRFPHSNAIGSCDGTHLSPAGIPTAARQTWEPCAWLPRCGITRPGPRGPVRPPGLARSPAPRLATRWGDSQPHSADILVVTPGEVLLASSEWRKGMLRATLQRT